MAQPKDVLKFRCTKKGDVEMQTTDFAERLAPQIKEYLQERQSIPAFLASVTLRLLDS